MKIQLLGDAGGIERMHCSVYLIIFILLLHEELASVYLDTFLCPNCLPYKIDPPTILPKADTVALC